MLSSRVLSFVQWFEFVKHIRWWFLRKSSEKVFYSMVSFKKHDTLGNVRKLMLRSTDGWSLNDFHSGSSKKNKPSAWILLPLSRNSSRLMNHRIVNPTIACKCDVWRISVTAIKLQVAKLLVVWLSHSAKTNTFLTFVSQKIPFDKHGSFLSICSAVYVSGGSCLGFCPNSRRLQQRVHAISCSDFSRSCHRHIRY